MLGLALALAGCDDGKYWYDKAGNCIKVSECARLKLNAYNFWGQYRMCSNDYIPDTASGFRPGDDGGYACPSRTYTFIVGNTVGCVKTLKECDNMYTLDEKNLKACVDTPDKCGIYWRKSYNWTGTNECIQYKECVQRGGFVYLTDCLTSDHCIQLNRHPYAYGT